MLVLAGVPALCFKMPSEVRFEICLVFLRRGESPSVDREILVQRWACNVLAHARRERHLLMGFWSWLVLHKSLKHHSWLSCSSASLHVIGFPTGCLVSGVWKYTPGAASPPQMVIHSPVTCVLCWVQSMHLLLCIGTTDRKRFRSEVISIAEGQTFRVHGVKDKIMLSEWKTCPPCVCSKEIPWRCFPSWKKKWDHC